jgi:eukaryotic-like serine/threonine-protein kinase
MQAVLDPVSRAQARLGAVLAEKWRLERVLGVGGVATVYLATHRNKNRVAIKLLHAELAHNTEIRSRFTREGYLANSIDHPGVVRVVDDDYSPDGLPFLVMELLEGETLEERASRHGGRLPAGEVLALVDQLLDVLIVAHRQELVHRDLKPDNLFLTREGRLKVLDFGIAHLVEVVPHGAATAVGMLMGTPAFMPPEQARSRWQEVDAKSDLYAVGASMFYLLSGQGIRHGETLTEQLAQAIHAPAPKLQSVLPDINGELARLVDQTLAYEKEDRFESAAQMQLEVRRVMASVPAPSTTSVAPTPSGESLGRAGTVVSDRWSAGAQSLSVARAITISVQRRPALLLLFTLLSGTAIAGWFALRQPSWVGPRGSAAQLAPAAPPALTVLPPPSAMELPSARPAVPSASSSVSPRQVRRAPPIEAIATKSRAPGKTDPQTESFPQKTSHDDLLSKRY